MPYATLEDLGNRIAPEILILLADDNDDGAADEAILSAALIDGSADIDASIGTRYVTPVGGGLPILRRWCVDLAVEQLFLRRREAMSPEFAARAELTRKSLNAVEGGIVGLAGAVPHLGGTSPESTRRGQSPTFGRETLEDF